MSPTHQLPGSRHFSLTQLADGVYAAVSARGGGAWCNAGIVDLGEQTLVFDTFVSPQAARDLRAAAEVLTGKPVSFVINSHWHLEHVIGNQEFPPTATIISTPATRNLMDTQLRLELEQQRSELPAAIRSNEVRLSHETDPAKRLDLEQGIASDQALLDALPEIRLRLPSQTFGERLTLHGTKRTVELVCHGGGHSESDMIMCLPQDGVVFTGDLVTNLQHPVMFFEPPEVWNLALAWLDAQGFTAVVPGHGPICDQSVFGTIRAYLGGVERAVEEAFGKGHQAASLMEVPLPSEYKDWRFPDFYWSNLKAQYRLMDPKKRAPTL